MSSEEQARETMTRYKTDTEGYKRRTMWFGQKFWDAIGVAADEDDRTVSSWLRLAAEEKLKRRKKA